MSWREILIGIDSENLSAKSAQSAKTPFQGNSADIANIADRVAEKIQASTSSEKKRTELLVLDDRPQSRLIRLAIQSGIFDQGIQLEEKEIAALVPPTDWRDVSNCDLDELKAWGAALAMRAVRYRGKVPRGWDKVAYCAHCGPVWSEHNLDTLSCGWCDMRLAGKWFPTPEGQEE